MDLPDSDLSNAEAMAARYEKEIIFVPGMGFMAFAICASASIVFSSGFARLGHILWNSGAESFENSVGMMTPSGVR